MANIKQGAAWLGICTACVAGFEGIKTVAYLDPVGVPTLCMGETQGVKIGDRATLEQCKALLVSSLIKANNAVQSCVKVPLPDARHAAVVSLTYNIGGHAFCGSTLVKKLNAGDTVGACNEFSKWTFAHGIQLPGLVKRREEERKLCMKDLM